MNVYRIFTAVLLFLFVIVMLVITVPYLSLRTDIGFLLTKQLILHKKIWLLSFYVHITSSLMVLLTGGLQLVMTNASSSVHRRLGILYVLLILFLSAPSGLIMACYANGGIPAQVSFIILSILWWFYTYRAYITAKDKNWGSHRSYMLRSYALTLAAISLRLYVMVLPFFFHLSAKEAYILVSYLSWIPNLLIAEFIIRKTKFFSRVVRRHSQEQMYLQHI